MSLVDEYNQAMQQLADEYKADLQHATFHWEVGDMGGEPMAVFSGQMSMPTGGLSKEVVAKITKQIQMEFPYVSDSFMTRKELVLMIEPDDIGHPSDFLKYLQTLKAADRDYGAIKNIVAAGLQDSLMV